jgi:DNA-binding protein H-NS
MTEITDTNNLDSLLEQRTKLNQHIESLLAAKKAQAVEQCKTLIKTFVIEPHELFSTSAPKNAHVASKTIPPKYRDPVSGATWSGRGLKPRWIGDDKAKYLIGS